MVFKILAIARDCSVLILGLEIFVMLLLPIFVLWYATRWLKDFIPQAARFLQNMKAEWFRIVSRVDLVMTYIRTAFIWIGSKSEGLRAFLSRMRSI